MIVNMPTEEELVAASYLHEQMERRSSTVVSTATVATSIVWATIKVNHFSPGDIGRVD